MNYFAAGLAQLRESGAVDELDNILQGCLHHRLATANNRETQYRTLPKILIAALALRR